MLNTFFVEISLVLFNSKIHSFIKTIQINHHVDFSSLVLVNISINTSWSAPSSILNPRHFIYWYSGRDYHFQKKILDFWWTINKQKSKIEKKISYSAKYRFKQSHVTKVFLNALFIQIKMKAIGTFWEKIYQKRVKFYKTQCVNNLGHATFLNPTSFMPLLDSLYGMFLEVISLYFWSVLHCMQMQMFKYYSIWIEKSIAKYEGELCVDIIMWDSVNHFHFKKMLQQKALMGFVKNILKRI